MAAGFAHIKYADSYTYIFGANDFRIIPCLAMSNAQTLLNKVLSYLVVLAPACAGERESRFPSDASRHLKLA